MIPSRQLNSVKPLEMVVKVCIGGWLLTNNGMGQALFEPFFQVKKD